MTNNKELIDQLKQLREEIHLMNGVVFSVKRYEDVVKDAEKRINSILYDLTGDKYYNKE